MGQESKDQGEIRSASGHPLPARWLPLIATIWVGQAFSMLSSYAAAYAAVWYITQETDSALMLAVAGVCAYLPTGLLSPFAGVMADRYNRKTIMVAAESFVGIMSLVLGIIIFLGHATIGIILIMILARSAGNAFRAPTLAAAMPMMVPSKHLMRINTLDQLLMSLSAIISPALGIFLYTAIGFYSVMFLDALGAALAVGGLMLARIPTVRDEEAARNGVWQNLRVGWRAIATTRGLVVLLAGITIGMVIFMPTDSLFPLLTYDHFNGDGYMASAAEASFGIGMLIGSLIIMVWGGGTHLARLMFIAAVIAGVTTAWCGLLAPDQFTAFLVVIFIMSIASAWFNAPLMTLMQRYIPEQQLGRAMGLLTAAIGVATPVGIAIGGVIAQYTGVAEFYVIDGAACTLLGILLYVPKSVRALDKD